MRLEAVHSPGGMAAALMHEVAELLEKLAASGDEASIDLKSLPMTDSDRQQLEQQLGRGEVVAALALPSESEIWETAYSGVWWIRHLSVDGQVFGEEIAITHIPQILLSHPSDIKQALLRLREDLAVSPFDHTGRGSQS